MMPLLTVMLGIWLYGMVKVFAYEAILFIYFNCFMLLRSAQIYMIADAIRIKLEIINEDAMDLIDTEKEKASIDLSSVRAKMEKIRKEYLCLKDLTICLNDADGWSMLCIILLFTCFLICTCYWFMLSLIRDIVMLESYESLCYILMTFLVLAIINHPCTQCLNLVIF